MASAPESISPQQLKLARAALFHQNGDALRTLDSARAWLDAAGLVPYYPHAQFAAAPQPSFAEAVLGRPENGWIPNRNNDAAAEGSDESYAVEVEDEEPEDEVADPDDLDEDDEESDEDFDDDEEDDEEEENDDLEADEDADPAATDPEVMLSNDDELEEDEGDEIAELDRIHAAGDPVPNDLRANEQAEAPAAAPVNGFTPEEREVVTRTLARMVAEGSAVPLNLLGSNNGEPDYVCSAQAFSFVYTLRGDKGWKQEPSQTGNMRVSPLAVKIYALLKEKGAQAPHELTAELGQGIVDSAVLRALSELWAIQRVVPIPDVEGEPAKWELMSGRYIRHIKAGANAGQPTALSALLSLYLSQAVAATSDEMETYLSPLAARSRVREVVGGLSATKQLESAFVEGKTVLYLPGALDVLPTLEAPQVDASERPQRSRYEADDRRAMIEERNARFAAEGGAPERRGNFPVRKPAGAREGAGRGDRREGGGERRPFGGKREGGFAPPRRSGAAGFGRDDRERRPFQRRDDGAPAGDRPRRDFDRPRNEFARPWDEERGRGEAERSAGERGGSERGERRPFAPRGEGQPFTPRGEGRPYGDRKLFAPRGGGDRPFARRDDGERRPFRPREGDERRPFTPREGGERRPFAPREGGERRPFAPRGDRPFRPRQEGEGRPFTPRGDRPYRPREEGERRPFRPREEGDRRPFAPRGDRPFPPREGGERRPFTPRGDRPFTPREDRPFTPRGDRPFSPREGGERRPFTPRGDRPFTPREGGARPFSPRGEGRPFERRDDGDRRPFTPRGEGRPFGDRKPFGGPRKPFGSNRPAGDAGERGPGRFSGEPGESRPSFRSGGKSAGPGGAKFGGSGFGRDRKAGPGRPKPGFSPSRKGPGSGPGRGGAPKRRPE